MRKERDTEAPETEPVAVISLTPWVVSASTILGVILQNPGLDEIEEPAVHPTGGAEKAVEEKVTASPALKPCTARSKWMVSVGNPAL